MQILETLVFTEGSPSFTLKILWNLWNLVNVLYIHGYTLWINKLSMSETCEGYYWSFFSQRIAFFYRCKNDKEFKAKRQGILSETPWRFFILPSYVK